MGSLHDNLFLHTEVRWLYRGNVASRVFELHKGLHFIYFFLPNTNPICLLYLLILIGFWSWPIEVIFLKAQHLKFIHAGQCFWFFLCRKENGCNCNAVRTITYLFARWWEKHIWFHWTRDSNKPEIESALKIRIRKLFPPWEKQLNWIRDPFNADAIDTSVTTFIKEQFIQVSYDHVIQRWKTNVLPLGTILLDFWIRIGKECIRIVIAFKCLVVFSTTYLFEKGFSSLTYLKSKCRNKLIVEDEFKVVFNYVRT